jgi:succinoglycan biosynthesis protein ExoA
MNELEARNTAEPIFISVVLPVLNEEKFLRSVLEALVKQSYPLHRFEILVVDGGSTDATLSVARSFAEIHPNVRVLMNPAKLSSAGRNVGARAAKGDVVLYVDGHCEVPDASLLESLNGLFERTAADVICRPQPLEVLGMTPVQKAISIARTSRLGHNPRSHIFSTGTEGFVSPESSGAAYRRRVFEKIGYYDECLDACEDVDFNLRARQAGFKAFTSPCVTVRYRPRDNMTSLFRQMLRYGEGRARLFLKHRGSAPGGPLFLGIPLLVFVALAVLSFFSHTALLALLALLLAYLAVLATASVIESIKSESGLAILVFFSLAVTHAGLLVGFWRGLLARSAGRHARRNER